MLLLAFSSTILTALDGSPLYPVFGEPDLFSSGFEAWRHGVTKA